MTKTKVIHTGKTVDRWLKLMEHIQHSTSMAVRCIFEDEDTAKKAYKCISANIGKGLGGGMVAFRKHNIVFMVKVHHTDVLEVIDHDSV